MAALLVSALIALLILCVIAAIVCWILSNIPGVPAWSPRVVWAVVGIIVLIWIVEHLSLLTNAHGC